MSPLACREVWGGCSRASGKSHRPVWELRMNSLLGGVLAGEMLGGHVPEARVPDTLCVCSIAVSTP